MAITGADAKDERTGLLRRVWMIPWFAVLQAQPLRSKASELASECLDGTAGARSSGKKLLKSSKKAATKAAPSMYEKWVCTAGNYLFFVRWEVVFLSVGRLLCSFCAAFLEARDRDKRCSFFPCDLARRPPRSGGAASC